MNVHSGFFHLTLNQHLGGLDGPLNGFLDEVALFGHGFFEDPIHHFGLDPRVTNA